MLAECISVPEAIIYCACMLSCFSCVRLFANPWTVCSPPGSSVHGILQARKLEWVALPSSRGSSPPRDQTWVSCIAGGFFTAKSAGKPYYILRHTLNRLDASL